MDQTVTHLAAHEIVRGRRGRGAPSRRWPRARREAHALVRPLVRPLVGSCRRRLLLLLLQLPLLAVAVAVAAAAAAAAAPLVCRRALSEAGAAAAEAVREQHIA